ncbi:hypothetical protein SAMN05216266_10944 [Amycolatopsis marina]|uniref:Uncharacterized protein n=1 Tax=Amycolatopsis marina TaxID=490629 RepID=A0A1I1AIP0_9PSEU|nr:hypothetical protein [Amycolatopsis marina]SFB36203.1 hypothetical protein SAMN05216266_10944 [Amycolatopsis marina]
MDRKPRKLLLGVLLCTVPVLPSCAGAPAQDAEVSAAFESRYELPLPFDEYKWSPQDQWLLEQARHRLVKHCVEARGATFTLPEQDGSESRRTTVDNSRRYGVLDPAAVHRFGYHVPTDPASERREAVTERWVAQVGAGEEAAIYGTADDPGCYAAADEKLAATAPAADAEWLGAQSADSVDQSMSTPEVSRTLADWRRCMTEHGFDYADPYAALGDERWNLDAPEVTPLELRAAELDLDCKRSSDLTSAWQQAETSRQERIIDEHADRFERLRVAKRAQLDLARQVLAD